MKYVPLGSSCGTTTFLQAVQGRKGPNHPFDWALTNPEFVLKIIQLCIQDVNSYEIVTKHFFKERYVFDHRHMVSWKEPGQGQYANTDFRVAFPHEDHRPYDDLIETYVRRMDRLKESIRAQEPIWYIWSPSGENRNFDGKPIVTTLEPLNDIAQLLKSNNPYARILVCTEEPYEFTSEIEHYVITKSFQYGEVAGKIHDIFQKIQ